MLVKRPLKPKTWGAVFEIYHWVYDESVFSVERQRIQLALIMLFMVYTTSRPGTIIECSGYRGSNEALCYENVTLRLVRNPLNEMEQVSYHGSTTYLIQRSKRKDASVCDSDNTVFTL